MPDANTPIRDEDLLADAIPIEIEEEDDPSGDAMSLADNKATIPMDSAGTASASASGMSAKIQMFDASPLRRAHANHWNRTPNATGTGAIHVKTFVAKLRLDAIDNLDDQVNHWLDAHPEYEVKFVTTTVGKLVGKISEDAIFMNVWV